MYLIFCPQQLWIYYIEIMSCWLSKVKISMLSFYFNVPFSNRAIFDCSKLLTFMHVMMHFFCCFAIKLKACWDVSSMSVQRREQHGVRVRMQGVERAIQRGTGEGNSTRDWYRHQRGDDSPATVTGDKSHNRETIFLHWLQILEVSVFIDEPAELTN